MSTYTGVIAASQKRCNCGAERLTDLYIEQDIYYLTSQPYPVFIEDGITGKYAEGIPRWVPKAYPEEGVTSSQAWLDTSTSSLNSTLIYGEVFTEDATTGRSAEIFVGTLNSTILYGTTYTEDSTTGGSASSLGGTLDKVIGYLTESEETGTTAKSAWVSQGQLTTK